ncbi:MAG: flavodoxin family protein [Cellulosilyticaceae bacterium]
MGVLVLDGMPKSTNIGNTVCQQLEELGVDYKCFKLEEMTIAPCRNCSGCQFKTPGECIVKDDTPQMIRALIKSEVVLMLTEITFGGYSSTLKKAMDKWGVLGLPSFVVKGGRLQHPPRYGADTGHEQVKIVIGIGNDLETDEKESFVRLVEANSLIMDMPLSTYIVNQEEGGVEERIGEIVKGVIAHGV